MLNNKLSSGKLQRREILTYAIDHKEHPIIQCTIVAPIKLVAQANDRNMRKVKVKKLNNKSCGVRKSSANQNFHDCNISKIQPNSINGATDTISTEAQTEAIVTATMTTGATVTTATRTTTTTTTTTTMTASSSTKITVSATASATAIPARRATVSATTLATAIATVIAKGSTSTIPIRRATATASATASTTAKPIAMSMTTVTATKSQTKPVAIQNRINKNDCIKYGRCNEWKSPFKSFITSGARKRNSAKYFAYDLSRDELKHFAENNAPMKPASAMERQLLHNGQRLQYLNQRYEHLPHHKYNYPEATSWRIGWLHR